MRTTAGTDSKDEVQRQARALGDPTRHAIFRYVDAATEPVTVAELTEHLGLNHNAIRQHLAKLRDAGLLVEELAAPTGRGRRRLQYRTAPAGAGAWGGESPYEQLSLLLVELVRSGRTPSDVGYDAGRRLGRQRARSTAHDGADPLDALEALVARQGFEPRRVQRGGRVELVLDSCPFETAAAAGQSVVCDLHRGMAQGMADAISDDLDVTDLVAHSPRRAGCRLQTNLTEGAEHV